MFGLALLKSPMFLKGLVLVVMVTAVLGGIHTIKSQATQIGSLKQDLNDTEEELLSWVEDYDRNNRILADLEKKIRDNKVALVNRLSRIRKLEEEANEEYRSCLDVAVPDNIYDSMLGSDQNKDDKKGAHRRDDDGLSEALAKGKEDRGYDGLGHGAQLSY